MIPRRIRFFSFFLQGFPFLSSGNPLRCFGLPRLNPRSVSEGVAADLACLPPHVMFVWFLASLVFLDVVGFVGSVLFGLLFRSG